MNLTDEQERFARHKSEVFLEACPGAGKTKSIVSRLGFISQSLPLRKGVAILSFTNKAIDEFKKRIGDVGLSSTLRHPGFIGTFDSFVRHFIFSPAGIDGSNIKPEIIDSWDTLGVEIRLRGSNSFRGRTGVSLDRFHPETGQIDPLLINDLGLRSHVQAHKDMYEAEALRLRNALHRNGYYSANDARFIALQRIRQERWGRSLGQAMSGRFFEIIIDEGQDCNSDDIEILKWLKNNGVHITFVCDRNQSVYGFRDRSRPPIQEFSDNYQQIDKLALTGNFRSSQNICDFASTLKDSGTSDLAVGEAKDIAHPIHIITYSGRKVSSTICQRFIQIAESEDVSIPRSDLIVLSHKSKSARIASGNLDQSTPGESKIEQLARIVGMFWTGTTSHEKQTALRLAENFLLLSSGNILPSETPSQAIQRLNINRRILRRQALDLVMCLPRSCPDTDTSKRDWVERAKNKIIELKMNQPGHSINQSMPNPRNSNWLRHLEQASYGEGLRYSTIHNAKGGEYPAVCVVIPPDVSNSSTTNLFNSWETKSEHESKRVIYVGATRAKELLVIAIPEIFLVKCTNILNLATVPYIHHPEI